MNTFTLQSIRLFWRSAAIILSITLTIALFAQTVRAQAVLRDAEIETLMSDYAKPIFRVAGIKPSSVDVLITKDRRFNAFVASSKNIFISSGAVTETETPNELIGVIAHETGHLTGGHLIRLRQEIEHAQTVAAIGMLIGAGLAATTARSNAGLSRGFIGLAQNAGNFAVKGLLKYRRNEELSADQAAIKYLSQTSQSPKGMVKVFERLADSDITLTAQEEYLSTHPTPIDRIRILQENVKNSSFVNKVDPTELQQRHDLARAKLVGYLYGGSEILRRYPLNDKSLAARYARAIAFARSRGVEAAKPMLDDLIKSQPKNPYFYELKGQFLLEAGKLAQAEPLLAKAYSLSGKHPLIGVIYGHALVLKSDLASNRKAVDLLKNIIKTEPDMIEAYEHLARGYAKIRQTPLADLSTAKAHARLGNMKEAKIFASRAQKGLNRGSVDWNQAEDIVSRAGEQ